MVMSAGRNVGVIGDEIFSAIVLMVAVSVIVYPVLLKFAIKVKETRTTPEPTSLSMYITVDVIVATGGSRVMC